MLEAVDHTKTMALIIGASEFPEDSSIHAIPNVVANIDLLRASLTDPNLIGIPEQNVIVSLNEDKRKIEKKLRNVSELTREKNSTMLVYYTGHGILSSRDFKLYLTTYNTSKTDLEIDGIHIDILKSYIKRSRAGRKIVILDCCHSGAFIEGSMGSVSARIHPDTNDSAGTYIMTSAAEDEPAMFPIHSPAKPTYFTGKLVDVINNGLDIENEYCTLRDIYERIEYDFKSEGRPQPQQATFNNADEYLFLRNKRFKPKRPEDELAWEAAIAKNTVWDYIDFRRNYPKSVYNNLAKQKVHDLEEEEQWALTLRKGRVFALEDFLDKYDGQYAEQAHQLLASIRENEQSKTEKTFWSKALSTDDLASYQSYLNTYPNGIHAKICREKINQLLLREKARVANEDSFSSTRIQPPGRQPSPQQQTPEKGNPQAANADLISREKAKREKDEQILDQELKLKSEQDLEKRQFPAHHPYQRKPQIPQREEQKPKKEISQEFQIIEEQDHAANGESGTGKDNILLYVVIIAVICMAIYILAKALT